MAFILAGCDVKSGKAEPEAPSEFAPVKPQRGELDPGDLGIYKCVYEVKLPAGKVMVLQWSKIVPGQPPKVREIIYAYAEAPARETVLVYNPRLFPFNPEPDKPASILVKMAGEQFRLPPDIRCTIVHSAEEPFALYLSNSERWVYKCFIESYDSVKARIPDLPAAPATGGWNFNSKIFHGVME